MNNPMNFENDIKMIKQAVESGKIEKAKCEERLEGLNRQKQDILNECDRLGVNPDNMSNVIAQKEQNLQQLIMKAKGFLPNNNMQHNINNQGGPF